MCSQHRSSSYIEYIRKMVCVFSILTHGKAIIIKTSSIIYIVDTTWYCKPAQWKKGAAITQISDFLRIHFDILRSSIYHPFISTHTCWLFSFVYNSINQSHVSWHRELCALVWNEWKNRFWNGRKRAIEMVDIATWNYVCDTSSV